MYVHVYYMYVHVYLQLVYDKTSLHVIMNPMKHILPAIENNYWETPLLLLLIIIVNKPIYNIS